MNTDKEKAAALDQIVKILNNSVKVPEIGIVHIRVMPFDWAKLNKILEQYK